MRKKKRGGPFFFFFHYALQEKKIEMSTIMLKYNFVNKVEMLRIKSTLSGPSCPARGASDGYACCGSIGSLPSLHPFNFSSHECGRLSRVCVDFPSEHAKFSAQSLHIPMSDSYTTKREIIPLLLKQILKQTRRFVEAVICAVWCRKGSTCQRCSWHFDFFLDVQWK